MSKKRNKKLWNIHNWIGLYAGVVIAVLSITGVLALFKVEIDETINTKYFNNDTLNKEANFHPDTNKLIDSLKLEYGAANLALIEPSLDTSKNWTITFGVKGKSILDLKADQIFFNPYTAKIIGIRDPNQTFAYYIRHLHVRLFNSYKGRIWVGFGGIALLISTITGILIYGTFMKRQFFGAIRKKNLKLKSADYHKIIGMATLLFNLMIAITGAWLGLQSILAPVFKVKNPKVYEKTKEIISEDEDVAHYVDYIKMFETSRTLFPDLIPTQIISSKKGNRTVTIKGNVPKTAYESRINYIILDKKDYSELKRYDIREQPLSDKIYYAQEGLHYGNFGGIWVKIIYSFFGLTSGVLSILGFVLYLERTKSKQKNKVNYKTTGKKIWLWSFWITLICVLLYILTITINYIILTILTTLITYGTLLFYLIKFLVVFSKRKYEIKSKRTTK